MFITRHRFVRCFINSYAGIFSRIFAINANKQRLLLKFRGRVRVVHRNFAQVNNWRISLVKWTQRVKSKNAQAGGTYQTYLSTFFKPLARGVTNLKDKQWIGFVILHMEGHEIIFLVIPHFWNSLLEFIRERLHQHWPFQIKNIGTYHSFWKF